MGVQFTLTQDQRDTLQDKFDAGDYSDGYAYVRDQIRNHSNGDANSGKWFDYASSINGNKPHAVNRYVRGAITEAVRDHQGGRELTDQEFQAASDDLNRPGNPGDSVV